MSLLLLTAVLLQIYSSKSTEKNRKKQKKRHLHIKNNKTRTTTRTKTTGAAENNFCWMHTKNQRKWRDLTKTKQVHWRLQIWYDKK